MEVRDDAVVIAVRAHAGTRRNEVCGIHDGALRVHVSVAPEKGKANRAIAEVVADFFGVRRSQVELLSGPASHQKKFRIQGISSASIQERIDSLE